ncbi:hypothetical protein SVAN01_01093 [Stagonosporopsis vannaccii]|nr:hypothetical protein SVAN01_01093 [Stagonosporopsis vannaccii]
MAQAACSKICHHDNHQDRKGKASTATSSLHQHKCDITSTRALPAADLTLYSIQPGDSLSLLHPEPTSLPFQTHRPTHTTSTSRATSNYPRVSPPSILYPHPIVPPHIYEVMPHARSHEPRAPHTVGSVEASESISVQTWLAVLVLVVVTVAGCWSVVVVAVHWRGVTTGMGSQAQAAGRRGGDERGSEDEHDDDDEVDEEKEETRGGWGRWFRAFNFACRSKYNSLPIKPLETEFEDRTVVPALSSAYGVLGRQQELSSPENPLLVAPNARARVVRPRGSAEWAEQHRAFFADPASASGSSAQMLSGTEVAHVEMEAREAHGGKAAVADKAGCAMGDVEVRSWVDLGLTAVDDAVDRVVARIVKWTDDGGRDEELVLPLAKGKVE